MNSKLESCKAITNDDFSVKGENIPKYIVDGAARATLHALRRYFEQPGVKRDYEAWKRKQQLKT